MHYALMVLVAGAGAVGLGGAAIAAAIHGDYWWALAFGLFAAIAGKIELTRGEPK